MPVDEGRNPVSKLARDGLHSGDWQCALVNSVPRAASASILGVFVCGCVFIQPTQSFRSSIEMNSTLGFSPGFGFTSVACTALGHSNALPSSAAYLKLFFILFFRH